MTTRDKYEHLLHEDEMQRWARQTKEFEAPRKDAEVRHADVRQLRRQIQQLEGARQEDHKIMAELVATILKVVEDMPRWIESATKKCDNELRVLIAERCGELTGQIRGLEVQARKSEQFRFAGELAENDGKKVN